MNWYDTHTLEPKAPYFISSVDSGNLVASLWTLQQGCLEHLHQPLFSRGLTDGFLDYLRALVQLRAFRSGALRRYEAEIQGDDWLTSILNFPEESLDEKKPRRPRQRRVRHNLVPRASSYASSEPARRGAGLHAMAACRSSAALRETLMGSAASLTILAASRIARSGCRTRNAARRQFKLIDKTEIRPLGQQLKRCFRRHGRMRCTSSTLYRKSRGRRAIWPMTWTFHFCWISNVC